MDFEARENAEGGFGVCVHANPAKQEPECENSPSVTKGKRRLMVTNFRYGIGGKGNGRCLLRQRSTEKRSREASSDGFDGQGSDGKTDRSSRNGKKWTECLSGRRKFTKRKRKCSAERTPFLGVPRKPCAAVS